MQLWEKCVRYFFLLRSIGWKTTPRPSVPLCKVLCESMLFKKGNVTFWQIETTIFLNNFSRTKFHHGKRKMKVEHAPQLSVNTVWNKANQSNNLLLLKVPAIKSFDDHCTDKLNKCCTLPIWRSEHWLLEKHLYFLSGDTLHSPHTFLPQHFPAVLQPPATWAQVQRGEAATT